MNDDLEVKIGANIDDLIKNLNKAKRGLNGFESKFNSFSNNLKAKGREIQSVGKSLSTYLTLPLLAAGGASIKMASDFEESMNKVDVAFKSSSNQVRAFAKTALTNFGIAEGSALDMAALFGDMSTSMGLTTMEAAKMSTELVGLAGDLASFKNINIKEVTTALNGVFTGETESLKMLGIVMTEVNLKQFAMSQGIQKNIKDMTQAEKVQLRYRYILNNTKNAQGDFARTSGGAANQMRIFQESLKELSASFGQLILPAFTKIVKVGNNLVNLFKNLSTDTKAIVLAVGGLTAALPLMITMFGGLITVLGALISPIGLAVAALAGLAYIVTNNWDVVNKALVDTANYFIDLYNESLGFRIIVESLVSVFKNLYTSAKQTFAALWNFIKDFGSNIVSLFGGIKKVFKGVFTLDMSLFKEGLSEMGTAAAKNLSDMADLYNDSGDSIGTILAKSVKEGYEKAGKNEKIEFVSTDDVNKSLGSVGDYISKKWKEIKNSIFGGGGSSESGFSFESNQDYLNNMLGGLQAHIDNTFPKVLQKLTEFDKAANEIISGSISNTFMGLGDAIGNALERGGNVLKDVGNAVLSGLGGFLSDMGGLLIKYGTLAVLKGKLDLAILTGGPVAIAAGIAAIGVGIALKAAGAAIGNYANGASSSSYSGSDTGYRDGSSTSYSNSGSSGSGGTYVFEIQGTKLVGVLKNTLNKNKSLGGTLSLT